MNVKFYQLASDKLDDLPVVSGQLICLNDAYGMYYDMDDVRRKLEPGSEVLYELFATSEVSSTGPSAAVDYSIDTGTLAGLTDITNTSFSELEFVFYDKNNATQFSSRIHGLRYGNGHQYTYAWNNTVQTSCDLDTTPLISDTNIYRSTIYTTTKLLSGGTFSVTEKRIITETVKDGIVTMEEDDISHDNRVALIKVIGRR